MATVTNGEWTGPSATTGEERISPAVRVVVGQRVGLNLIPAPTQHLTGRSERDHLLNWLPSSGDLGKTGRAWRESLGLLALRLDH